MAQISQVVKRKTNTKLYATAFKELVLALHGPKALSRPELEEVTGLTNSTISRWIQMLRDAKLVYVADYRRDSDRGNWIELLRWGYMMPDTTRPKRMSDREYRRRYNIKRQKSVVITEKGLTHVSD